MASNSNEQIYKDVIITIGDENFAGITSFDYQLAVDMIETTNMNTAADAKSFKAGRHGETISVEGIHDPNLGATTMSDFWDLRVLAVAGTEATLKVYEDTASTGQNITLTALVNNISLKNQDNSAVNISASFQITGGSTVATQSA